MSIYLTDGKGLTSTSANFLANIAKEEIKEEESYIENLSFVNESIELINGNTKNTQLGITDVSNLEGILNKISEMHAFCAWIREAIKEKEALFQATRSLNDKEYAAKQGIEYPEFPNDPNYVKAEDIINEMNIKERNQYLRLEAFASTFGKYIHPNGEISDAREYALKKKNNPTLISGSGRDAIITRYELSLPVEEINANFMALQGKYREYERQLNAIKFHIKEVMNKRNLVLQNEYAQKVSEYQNQIREINNARDRYVIEETERISALKIVIPEKLQNVYEYLESLGK